MPDYPIFLLPKGGQMYTAKQGLNKEFFIFFETLFQSGKKYSISHSGIVAYLDIEKEIIIYGQLSLDGKVDYLKILKFPYIIRPKLVYFINDNIILTGENNLYYLSGFPKHKELIVEYILSENTYIILEIPTLNYDNEVGALLIEKNSLLAINTSLETDQHNFIYKRNLFDFRFNSNNIGSYNLIDWKTEIRDRVYGAAINENYLALLSNDTRHRNDDNYREYVKIFNIKTGEFFDGYCRNYSFGYEGFEDFDFSMDLHQDIFFVPNKDVLFIPSLQNGLGIYVIPEASDDRYCFDEVYINSEGPRSLRFLNYWGKNVSFVYSVPNDSENVIIIFEEIIGGVKNYSYSIENIENLLTHDNEVKTSKKDEFDEFGDESRSDFDDYEDPHFDYYDIHGDWGGLYGEEAEVGFWNTE